MEEDRYKVRRETARFMKDYFFSKAFLKEGFFWLAFFGVLTTAGLLAEHFGEKSGALKQLYLHPENVASPSSFLKEKGWDSYEADRYEPCLLKLKEGFNYSYHKDNFIGGNNLTGGFIDRGKIRECMENRDYWTNERKPS